MKTRVIVQARMLSQKLRGKSLMAIATKPLLYRVIDTVKKLDFIDEVVIATTRSEADDPIAAAANDLGVGVFRGDSVNVLKRFVDASNDLNEEDNIVRITADNPLCNYYSANKAFKIHVDNNNDYTHIEGLSHVLPEFIKVRALREANSLASTDFDKQHVTPFLRKNKDHFKVETLSSNYETLRGDLDKFLTVDTPEDLKRFEELLNETNYDNSFDIETVYSWLDKLLKPELKNNVELISKLGNVIVGDNMPTFVIAEIGQNHNGDVEMAKQLIDMAVRCGADAVKFQKRDIPSELTEEAFNKVYDSPNSFGYTYGEHREFLELNEKEHLELKLYADSVGIPYFCTPCDIPSVDMMERIGVPFYKVASRDLTNIPLLHRLSETKRPVIISTGMASIEDIDDALQALGDGPESVMILQCISQYPAEMENVNLHVMKTLREKYGKITGFSDHTPGIIAAVTASVMGAAIIEKHITLDRAMKGSDQAGSSEETDLKTMIEYIKLSEKAKGDGVKVVNPATKAAKDKLARSLTSAVEIKKGTVLTEDMLCLKSPGTGLKWVQKDLVLGKTVITDIKKDVTITLEHLEK